MPRRTEPDEYALKVGQRLRALRLERKMTLGDFADLAGLSKGHLSSVEHGLAVITTQTIAKIADALSLPPLYVLTFAGEDERGYVLELVRKLPAHEVARLRRELTKAAKAAARAQSASARR